MTRGAALSGHKPTYVASFEAAVGSATLPQGSLYAVAANGFSLLEAYFITISSVAEKQLLLQRLTSTGTPGATQTAAKYDDDSPAAACTPKTTHTVAPGLGDGLHLVRVSSNVGQGIYGSFHDVPVECAPGTANGIGWLPLLADGTAEVTFVWEE